MHAQTARLYRVTRVAWPLIAYTSPHSPPPSPCPPPSPAVARLDRWVAAMRGVVTEPQLHALVMSEGILQLGGHDGDDAQEGR